MSDASTSENDTKPMVRYSVFVVDNFEGADGPEKSHWTNVGAANAHSDGQGFSIELAGIPVDGKLVIRAQKTKA